MGDDTSKDKKSGPPKRISPKRQTNFLEFPTEIYGVIANFLGTPYTPDIQSLQKVVTKQPIPREIPLKLKHRVLEYIDFNKELQKEISKHNPDLEKIKHLIVLGADVNIADTNYRIGNTPLLHILNTGLYQVERGYRIYLNQGLSQEHIKIIYFLLKKGADLHVRNRLGLNALDLAILNNSYELMKLFLKYGEYPPTYETFKYVFRRPTLEMVKLFLQYGFDIDTQNEDGDTLLMRVAESGDIKLVEYLLKHGANVNLKNKMGQTVLQKTLEFMKTFKIESRDIIDLLLKYGAI